MNREPRVWFNDDTVPAGPLVIVRVGPPDGGYFVGPFTPQQAVEWREENVTHPDQQWAIVPLLPDAAVPLTSKVQQAKCPSRLLAVSPSERTPPS